jgi:cytochrome P450
VLYNLFLHPLRHFPGRKSWAATRFPYVYSLFSGGYAHDLRALHDEYGKFVRTGPDELSIIDVRAWKDIYGYATKGKPEFGYNEIWTPRAINGAWPIIFAPKDDHTRMKRVLSPAFSMHATREQEPIIQKYADQLTALLRQKAQNSPIAVDINSYLLWTTFDMIVSAGMI